MNALSISCHLHGFCTLELAALATVIEKGGYLGLSTQSIQLWGDVEASGQCTDV